MPEVLEGFPVFIDHAIDDRNEFFFGRGLVFRRGDVQMEKLPILEILNLGSIGIHFEQNPVTFLMDNCRYQSEPIR